MKLGGQSGIGKLNYVKAVRYAAFSALICAMVLSCKPTANNDEIEPCAPDDETVLINSIGETVTEIQLSNWAVLDKPEGGEVLEFWTGIFRIECVRNIEGERPWTRLIDDENDKAGWTAP